MHYRTEASAERFLEIVSGSNAFDGVGGNQRETLRVLMPDDVCLMDTTSTDYAGHICRVRTPQDGKMYYMRLFYEGDTVLMCDPTDGEEVDRCKVDDLECSGIVTAIVRKMAAEERPDMKAWDEFYAKCTTDNLVKYYSPSWKYATAVKQHERGGGYGCFHWGYRYGFEQGRKAEKNAKRRKRRAQQRKAERSSEKS